MKCQRCQKREATILIRQSINGYEKEYALCQECMEKLGLAASFGFDFDNFLGGGFATPQLFPSFGSHPQNTQVAGNSGAFLPGKKESPVCKHCNTTLDEVRKKGRLGCAYCYEAFEEELKQVFRRIQSGEKHRGRRLAESREKNEIDKIHEAIAELQNKIKAAVDKEDYESAAIWKNEIVKNKEKIEDLEKSKAAHEKTTGKEKAAKKTNRKTPGGTSGKNAPGGENDKKRDNREGGDAK